MHTFYSKVGKIECKTLYLINYFYVNIGNAFILDFMYTIQQNA